VSTDPLATDLAGADPAADAVVGAGPIGALRRVRGAIALRNYTLLLVLAIVWVIFQLLTGGLEDGFTAGLFLTPRNLTLLALQAAITALAAISAVMLIVTRNFDISVGSAVALVGVVLAWTTVRMGLDPAVGIVLAMAAGVALGAWNGFWVARVGVPSFIVTLAGMLYFRGISMIVTNGATVSPVPPVLSDFAIGFLAPTYSIALVGLLVVAYAAFRWSIARRARSLGLVDDISGLLVRALVPAVLAAAAAVYVAAVQGLPYLVLLLGAAALAGEVLMRRMRFGSTLYAIGGNPDAARLAGIDVRGVIFRNFLIAGVAYGITGIALTARVNGAVAGSAGIGLELDAIAAAIIGGTSLAGGRGTILGALLGATLMGSLNNGMSLLNVPTFYQDTARGAVLLVAVAIDMLGRRRT
jgi:D-xylose transport system permease protein